MKKIFDIAYWVIVIFFIGFVAGIFCCAHECEIPEPQLLSITETQRRLIELGYDIKIDGKIGPKTLAAWDHAFCEQSAKQYFPEDDP